MRKIFTLLCSLMLLTGCSTLGLYTQADDENGPTEEQVAGVMEALLIIAAVNSQQCVSDIDTTTRTVMQTTENAEYSPARDDLRDMATRLNALFTASAPNAPAQAHQRLFGLRAFLSELNLHILEKHRGFYEKHKENEGSIYQFIRSSLGKSLISCGIIELPSPSSNPAASLYNINRHS